MKAAIVPSENSNWEVKEINMPEPGESQVLIKSARAANQYFVKKASAQECR
jgi:D-arabinose 1-dehydrogenase-like Zn-dependent alcohol dehydrogenase